MTFHVVDQAGIVLFSPDLGTECVKKTSEDDLPYGCLQLYVVFGVCKFGF